MPVNITCVLVLTVLIICVNGGTASWFSYTWNQAEHAGAQAGNVLYEGSQYAQTFFNQAQHAGVLAGNAIYEGSVLNILIQSIPKKCSFTRM